MGCASSTPMIATAGSEMLKAASNVAADATKSAEDAVQDVTHTVGKTLDTAKETVGTAVTGIANDFGNAIKHQTEALDDAKNHLLEKLHLGNGEHKKPEAIEGAVEVNNMTTTASMTAAEHEELDDIDIDERLSRGPTPAPDADSLKTSTPEPEIEQALANFKEESPPTPKPTLSELEQLKAEAKETVVNKTAAAVAVAATTTTAVAAVVTKDSTEKIHNDKDMTAETTNEPPVEKATDGVEARPGTTEWEKYADLLAHSHKYNPHDLYKRGGTLHRFGAPLNGHGMYSAFTRPTAVVHRMRDDDNVVGIGEHNYSGYNSPMQSNHSSTEFGQINKVRGRLPRKVNNNKNNHNHNEFAPLVAHEHNGTVRSRTKSPTVGRKFDFNPNRERLGSPVKLNGVHRSAAPSPIKSIAYTPSRRNSADKSNKVLRSSASSPIRTKSLIQNRVRSSSTNNKVHNSKSNSPVKADTLSKSSRSSTSNSIVIGSNHTTPISFKNLNTINSICDDNQNIISRSTSRSTSRLELRSRSPRSEYLETHKYYKSPMRVRNTSSFLSSPRTSPFSIRRSYAEYSDKENKTVFIADLSSISPSRNHLSPSPYKMRARCTVCNNKYVIK